MATAGKSASASRSGVGQDGDSVDVTPAKRFFVDMLTRDIELEDAILDLLDNCVDGAIRVNSRGGKKPSKDCPYRGFKAEIHLDTSRFSIKDNCGGIPIQVAKEYAFKFGRPRADIDQNIQTVGVYGIGMKRALFKLGKDCRVTSRSSDGAFSVRLDKAWIENEDQWQIALRGVKAGELDQEGVKIEVVDLHPSIASTFDRAASRFENDLITKIRDHYAYILQKGFEVQVNGTKVHPNLMQTVMQVEKKPGKGKAGGAIEPYLYQTEHEGVTVRLAMGMYAAFPTETELEEYTDGKRSKTTAGWTIVCNDRVVLSHDTSHRTGWGVAGVPAYHSQFSMLSGVVEFSCVDAAKLPVTTTKRGINLDSSLYVSVRDVMREALKHFTTFTNHWKSDTQARVDLHHGTAAIDIRTAAARISLEQWQDVRKGLKGRRYVPNLPKPERIKTHGRMSFERLLEDIERVRVFMEVPEEAKASEVGAAAFDWVASKA